MSLFTTLLILLFVVALFFISMKFKCEKCVKRGIISGFTTGTIYIIFSFVFYMLTNDETFSSYWETRKIIGNISLNAVLSTGISLAALVPIVIWRYKKIKEFFKYALSASISYVAVLFLIYMFISAFVCISAIATQGRYVPEIPLNSLDSIGYAVGIFPAGSLLGVFLTIIVNVVLNSKEKKSGLEKPDK